MNRFEFRDARGLRASITRNRRAPMTDTPTRFPLAWPTGRPRAKSRSGGPYYWKPYDSTSAKEITVARAMDRLEAELKRMGAVNIVVSTNLTVGVRGFFLSGQGEPQDPGVAVYFTLKGKQIVLALDAFTKLAQNIAGLAAHIEATRKIERIGVATAAETLMAFQALPPPEKPRRPWREVLQMTAVVNPDEEYVQTLYRMLSKRTNGDEAAQLELNLARDEALAELKPKMLT